MTERLDEWLAPHEFAAWIQQNWLKKPPLNSIELKDQLDTLSDSPQLSAQGLIGFLGEYISLNPVEPSALAVGHLRELCPICFALREGQFLPCIWFDEGATAIERLGEATVYLASEKLPEEKLTKLAFVGLFAKGRKAAFVMLLVLGVPIVLLSIIPELLQEPLFDNYIPEANIPAIILVGVASIAMQLSSQVIGGVSQLYQTQFENQVELATRTAVALRFLSASPQALPARDVGSWRISLQVAGSFLSSLQSLLVSIPLAIFSLLVNLIVVGAFTDPLGAAKLFLVLMIPTVISVIVTLVSSNLYVRIMGQQSRLEAIIFDVVKQIRAISMLGTKNVFVTRFQRSRTAIAESMVRSGMVGASAGIVSSIANAALYSYIFLQYYNSVTSTTSQSQQTVGSLLVIYFAVGTISGSLDQIGNECVSIIQTLPTYWTSNPLRDISAYRAMPTGDAQQNLGRIDLKDLTYLAPGLEGPFPHPIDLSLPCPAKVAIVGPSGSGKSTFLRLLAGNLSPKQGEVLLADDDGVFIKGGLAAVKTLVISQEVRLFGSTLRDVLDPQDVHSLEQLDAAAEKAGLTAVLDSLPLRWKTPVSEYSRDLSLGQLQLFKIARVLLGNYTVVLSDEPTCHLPEEMHLEAIRMINDNCQLHISTLHRRSGLKLFDTVLSINKSGGIEVES
jgi:ABC-type bacteriocin/lantibiotic exporter with double-glycine peptidase domain